MEEGSVPSPRALSKDEAEQAQGLGDDDYYDEDEVEEAEDEGPQGSDGYISSWRGGRGSKIWASYRDAVGSAPQAGTEGVLVHEESATSAFSKVSSRDALSDSS